MNLVKIAILAFALATVVGAASSTTLQNIEEIQPVSGQAIQITGEINLNSNSLTNIGSLGGCGTNQYLNGDGNCTTDQYDPDSNVVQSISITDHTISLSDGGGSVTVPDDTIPDDQALSITGHTISLDNGGSVTVPDNTIADNQGLSDVLSYGGSAGTGQTVDVSSGAFRLPVGSDAY
jgi:hypothetical protein